VCGYTGPQLRGAYGLTNSKTGSGVTVAVIDAYAAPTLESDAQTFASENDPGNQLSDSQFSELLPSTYTEQQKCGANGWFGEQSLDVEAVHDMAPGAHILYAGAQSCTTADLNAALRQVVDGHLADVVTNSYGDNAGDLLDSASSRQSTDQILEMAAGTGISVLFSSGDNGDEYTTVGQVAADYPASSPYATAVGGTTLQIGSSNQRLGEYGWSTARSFLCNSTYVSEGGCTSSQLNQWLPIDLALDGGSGGGTSVVYPQPWYQSGVVPNSLSESGGGAPMRVVPDISLEADPATGMLVGETQAFPDGTYYDTYRIGGTSVASPLFAGLLARAIQTGAHAFGLVNPALYSLAGSSAAVYSVGPAGKQDQSRSDYANSIDSSQGYLYTTRIIDYEGTEQFCPKAPKNAPCTQRPVALHTARGYDNMTGLGSPGTGLVAALAAHH
jgi:subtilase family serine protease